METPPRRPAPTSPPPGPGRRYNRYIPPMTIETPPRLIRSQTQAQPQPQSYPPSRAARKRKSRKSRKTRRNRK